VKRATSIKRERESKEGKLGNKGSFKCLFDSFEMHSEVLYEFGVCFILQRLLDLCQL